MEQIQLGTSEKENQTFLIFLDKLLQKKLDTYNLELLIQCERNHQTDTRTKEKAEEITSIRKEIKEYKTLKNPDNLLALMTDNQIGNRL